MDKSHPLKYQDLLENIEKPPLWEYTSGITPNTTPKMHPDVKVKRKVVKGALN